MAGRFVSRGNEYFVDGREVSKAEHDRLFEEDRAKLPQVGSGPFVGKKGKGWPKTSQSMAVHPSQRSDAIAESIAKGVPTDFDGEGRPVMRDAKHQKEYARKVMGWVNRDGGY